VVLFDAAANPAAHSRARCGDGSAVQGHALRDAVDRVVAVVADPHCPTLGRRHPGHGDVPAQADQHAALASESVECGGGSEVGCQCLGGGAEVDLDVGGRVDSPGLGRIAHPLPARHGTDDEHKRAAVERKLRKVDVVAGAAQRGPDGGVDVAVAQLRGAQCLVDGPAEERADPLLTTRAGVESHQLAVSAEAAAGRVNVAQDDVNGSLGRAQRVTLVLAHHQPHRRAQGPALDCRKTHGGAHEPPDTAAADAVGAAVATAVLPLTAFDAAAAAVDVVAVVVVLAPAGAEVEAVVARLARAVAPMPMAMTATVAAALRADAAVIRRKRRWAR
jgi:hypothetical protein